MCHRLSCTAVCSEESHANFGQARDLVLANECFLGVFLACVCIIPVAELAPPVA